MASQFLKKNYAHVLQFFFRTDDRWVWRSVRSPSSEVELTFNPFEPFESSSEEERNHASEIELERRNSPNIKFPSDEDIRTTTSSQRGSTGGRALTSLNPNINTLGTGVVRTPFSRGRNLVQNLGIAHFTIPRQLGQPVSVTTPTSNHLLADSEPLVSSYSSLDAEVSGVSSFGDSRNSGRNFFRSPLRQDEVGDFRIVPLPIDISKLPLESTERAEGMRKLWSSLTSRSEFAQIFDSLAGRRRNATSPLSEISPETEEPPKSSTILLDPNNSISESVIRVINPPQIQLQQQILKQQLRQQQLQKHLQEQFEAEIRQRELKKHLELQRLVQQKELEERQAIQERVVEEQRRNEERQQLIRLQQQEQLTRQEQLLKQQQELLVRQQQEQILKQQQDLLVRQQQEQLVRPQQEQLLRQQQGQLVRQQQEQLVKQQEERRQLEQQALQEAQRRRHEELLRRVLTRRQELEDTGESRQDRLRRQHLLQQQQRLLQFQQRQQLTSTTPAVISTSAPTGNQVKKNEPNI